jgi:hypothetical protein
MSTTFRILRDSMDLRPTTGQLFAPPDLNLQTMEDPWMMNARKVSCIPTGRYRCIVSYSTRFERRMPELLNVPDRSGIRIHGGNTIADTEGCILLGMQLLNPSTLGHSQQALGYFRDWLDEALERGQVYCEVEYAATV